MVVEETAMRTKVPFERPSIHAFTEAGRTPERSAKLQESNSLIDVVLVRLLVAFDPGADLGLLLTPLGDVAAVERLLLLLALPQRLPHPVEQGLGELKLPEDALKLPLKLLLPNVEPPAGALVEGAVVVDVAVLLDLGSDGAAAGGSPQKAGVGEAVGGDPSVVSLRGDGLHAVKEPLEHVDSSSGAIGTAVNNAIAELATTWTIRASLSIVRPPRSDRAPRQGSPAVSPPQS
jgi:hypothetical protein